MRASELLGAAVHGPAGQELGRVVDIRLVQDGPLLGAFAAMRLDGLVVGGRRLAGRLGYDRQEATGPASLRAAVRWWTRDSRYLPWTSVVARDGVLMADPAELRPVPRL